MLQDISVMVTDSNGITRTVEGKVDEHGDVYWADELPKVSAKWAGGTKKSRKHGKAAHAPATVVGRAWYVPELPSGK